MNRKNDTLGTALLLLCAAIWGAAFSMQELAAKVLAPCAVLFCRSVFSVLFLIIVVVLLDRIRQNGRRLFYIKEGRLRVGISKAEWRGGITSGVFLFLASYVQQLGISHGASAGVSGFITSLYMVFVPVFSIFLGKKVTKKAAVVVAVALFGFYLISVGEGFSLVKSDLLILLCALLFAWQILTIDLFSENCDGIRYSLVQFISCAVFSAPFALFVEKEPLADYAEVVWPLLFLGILSSGIAYTLQIVGQQVMTSPTVAGVLMSLENVFAALFAWIIFPAFSLSGREIWGCAVVCAAVLISQIPDKKKRAEN